MKAIFGAVIAAAVISSVVGFALGRVSDPSPAQASASSDSKTLKSIDKRLAGIQRSLGNPLSVSVQQQLDGIASGIGGSGNRSLQKLIDKGATDTFDAIKQTCLALTNEDVLRCPATRSFSRRRR